MFPSNVKQNIISHLHISNHIDIRISVRYHENQIHVNFFTPNIANNTTMTITEDEIDGLV